MRVLTPSESSALAEVAASLGVSVAWLKNLIAFESRFNPGATNPVTGARGLIQFMHATARAMGYDDADDIVDQFPDVVSQLRGPVYSYLAKYKPFPSEQSLYMAVFYPAARSWPMGQPFPEKVQKANPGIRTPGDYIAWVRKISGAVTTGTLLLIAAIAFFLIRRK